MAKLTTDALSNCPIDIASAKFCKSEQTPSNSAGRSPPNLPQQLIYVRYQDHVLYNRAVADFMQPQIRETVGWQVYDCEQYVILAWDRDAKPTTLKGGDPKASGLVLLKSDILEFYRMAICTQLIPNLKLNLKSQHAIQDSEVTFRTSERKTHGAKDSTRRKRK
jgi:hypothetical protein